MKNPSNPNFRPFTKVGTHTIGIGMPNGSVPSGYTMFLNCPTEEITKLIVVAINTYCCVNGIDIIENPFANVMPNLPTSKTSLPF